MVAFINHLCTRSKKRNTACDVYYTLQKRSNMWHQRGIPSGLRCLLPTPGSPDIQETQYTVWCTALAMKTR